MCQCTLSCEWPYTLSPGQVTVSGLRKQKSPSKLLFCLQHLGLEFTFKRVKWLEKINQERIKLEGLCLLQIKG